MYCLDKWAKTNLTATLYGSRLTRHDDYRELVFDVLPCKPDPSNGSCLKTSASEIQKAVQELEVVVMFDTQQFDPILNGNMSVTTYAEVRSFPL
jgi:hypothetical protein